MAMTHDPMAAAQEALRNQIESLLRMVDMLDHRYIHAVALLHGANNVITAGLGKSGFVAQKLAATLASVCVSARWMHPVDALHGDAGVVGEGDVVVVISKSGETPEVLRFADVMRGLGCHIISITSATENALASMSDVALLAPVIREMDEHDILPTVSTTSALVMADLLAIGVLSADSDPLRRLRRSHPDGMIGGTLLRSVADVMHTGAAVPRVSEDTTMLDALVEMTSKSLGIVCVMRDDRLVGILTDGDVRRLVTRGADLAASTIAEHMTMSPVTVTPTASLHEALQVMERPERQIGVLPVVDNEACVGVIRLHDIVRLQV
ncbi:MAG: KpsF/GutQ family sugar-phosphate isomerase [Candidatus Kapabacteria bacterium]|nr:KpsF/GutQ family sugar-phosphate isomerase [Candidatus Kapabacteria bacterium]